MLKNIIARVLVTIAWLRNRRSVVAAAAAMTAAPLLVGAPAYASTTGTDPLNGAGTDLVSALVSNFTTYVIPAVVTVIVAVYAFKMIVKLGTRFLNRA